MTYAFNFVHESFIDKRKTICENILPFKIVAVKDLKRGIIGFRLVNFKNITGSSSRVSISTLLYNSSKRRLYNKNLMIRAMNFCSKVVSCKKERLDVQHQSKNL